MRGANSIIPPFVFYVQLLYQHYPLGVYLRLLDPFVPTVSLTQFIIVITAEILLGITVQ